MVMAPKSLLLLCNLEETGRNVIVTSKQPLRPKASNVNLSIS